MSDLPVRMTLSIWLSSVAVFFLLGMLEGSDLNLQIPYLRFIVLSAIAGLFAFTWWRMRKWMKKEDSP